MSIKLIRYQRDKNSGGNCIQFPVMGNALLSTFGINSLGHYLCFQRCCISEILKAYDDFRILKTFQLNAKYFFKITLFYFNLFSFLFQCVFECVGKKRKLVRIWSSGAGFSHWSALETPKYDVSFYSYTKTAPLMSRKWKSISPPNYSKMIGKKSWLIKYYLNVWTKNTVSHTKNKIRYARFHFQSR